MEKLLMTVREFQEATGICRSLVYAGIKSGEIPSIRISRRSVRIPVAAVLDWIRDKVRRDRVR